MANEIQVLKQTELLGQQFAVYGTPDEPLFLAKDVAAWIEHTDTSKMVQCVDEDEKLTRTMFVSGQNREVWLLTENGLYEILMQSRKPIAKEFKKGVKKILHEIRTMGQYAVKPLTQGQMLVQMAQAYEAQERMLLEQQRRQSVIEHKVEAIENRIENNGFMSVMGFANIHHLNIGTKAAAAIGRLASKWCKRNFKRPEKTKYERWGEVNTYPMEALRVCFAEFYPDKSF